MKFQCTKFHSIPLYFESVWVCIKDCKLVALNILVDQQAIKLNQDHLKVLPVKTCSMSSLAFLLPLLLMVPHNTVVLGNPQHEGKILYYHNNIIIIIAGSFRGAQFSQFSC